MIDKSLLRDEIQKCVSEAMERGELQADAIDILKRGFARCHINSNQESTLLLTGINPSFNPKEGVWPNEVREPDVQKPSGRYWLYR